MPTPRPEFRRTLAALVAVAFLLVAPALGGCSKDDRPEPEGATTVDLAGLMVQTISRGPSEPDPDSRVTVLFLHDETSTSRLWDDRGILDAVVDAGYWVVAADLPGHGDTPEADRPPEVFMTQLVEAASAPGEVVVVAPSMAGEWTLALLQERPEVPLAGLVAIAPEGISGFRPPAEASEVPSLLVWGEDDEDVPPAKAEALAAKLPGSRIEIIPGAGHAPYDDAPKAFLRALLPFLAEVERTVPPRG